MLNLCVVRHALVFPDHCLAIVRDIKSRAYQTWSFEEFSKTNSRTNKTPTGLDDYDCRVSKRNGHDKSRVYGAAPKVIVPLFVTSMSYAQLQLPDSGKEVFTEYSRWRLLVNDGGRHTWHYLKTDEECERWPQNLVDKYWLGLPVVRKHVYFSFHTILNIF